MSTEPDTTEDLVDKEDSSIFDCWSIQVPIDLTILTRHFTDSTRKVRSLTGGKFVAEPGGGPRAVFKRPLTVLQISDGIMRAQIDLETVRLQRTIKRESTGKIGRSYKGVNGADMFDIILASP